jgi:hypothetical protein
MSEGEADATAQDAYRLMLREHIAPALRELGFRRVPLLKFTAPCSLTAAEPRCDPGCHTQKTAPSESANTPIRPASNTSNGSESTRPPASRTREAVEIYNDLTDGTLVAGLFLLLTSHRRAPGRVM